MVAPYINILNKTIQRCSNLAMVAELFESEFRELTERVILTLTWSRAASSVLFIGTSTLAADLSSKDSKMDFLLSISMTNTVNIQSCIPTSELEVKTNSKYRSNSSKSNYNQIQLAQTTSYLTLIFLTQIILAKFLWVKQTVGETAHFS